MCDFPSLSVQSLLEAGNNLDAAQLDRFQFRSGLFDNAFLINLPEEKSRLRDALHTLDKVELYAEKFKAFSGEKLRNGDYLPQKYFQNFEGLRNGELGCLFSHLAILYVASTHPDQDLYTVIFEDDIMTSATANSLQATLSSLETVINEEVIHFIYFGKCLESCTQMSRVIDNIYRAVSPSCTHSYAIKNSFAKKIIDDFEDCCNNPNSAINCSFFKQPIDKIYANYISYGIAKGLVVHPGIFYQDVLRKNSSVKNSHLLAYQECGDLNTSLQPVEQIIPNQNKRKFSTFNLKTVILVIFIIIVIILILKRRRGPSKISNAALGISGALILGIVIYYLSNRNNSKGLEKLTLNTILQYSRRGRNNFPINNSVVPSRKHDFFNPNGIMWTNSSGDPIFVTSTRSFDGISSYPLLQIYDPYIDGKENFKLLYSKILWLTSDRSMKSRYSLGYEDMRVFSYNNDIYLIGVNLDRSETGTPGMILVKLDEAYNHVKTWHLFYPPVAKFPNKNWAPIILNDGELGFVVDLDPVLIVKRIYKDHEYQEECELVYQNSERVLKPKIRNSTITVAWNEVPESFRPVFNKIASFKGGYRRFVMMGHTKYVSINILKTEVLYQHYFVVIDIPPLPGSPVEVNFSGPLHVEENYSPHIEYISGICFIKGIPGDDNSWILNIMYGLRDMESSYIILRPNELDLLIDENPLMKMPDIPTNH